MDPVEPSRSRWLSPWDLCPLLVAVVFAGLLPALLQGVPDPIPTHFDAHGHANGWTCRAAFPWVAFGLPAFVWTLLLLTGRAFVGSDQDPEGRKCEAMAPLRGLVTAGLLCLMGAMLLIPRFGSQALWSTLALFLGLVALGIYLMIRKMKRSIPDLDPGQHYRWGLFYVNPEDPSIWVPKLFGLGWTLNFAHGMSWVFLALLLLVPAIIIGLAASR